MSASSRITKNFYDAELGGSVFQICLLSEVTEDVDYDIDESVTALLANMTNRGNWNSDSYLSSEDCSSLTPEERNMWRKL